MMKSKVLERKITEVLTDWKENCSGECLLVTGARHVGKTFAIQQFIEQNFESHLTVNFETDRVSRAIFAEDSDVDRIMNRLSVSYPEFNPLPGKTVLFFDEIDFCPEARRSLKAFAIDGRYKVISSGSLMGLQYRTIVQNPVGYERRVEMRSLDFEEFLWAIGIGKDTISDIRRCIHDKVPMDRCISQKIDEYFTLFMVIGGMPKAVTTYLDTGSIPRAIDEKKKVIEGYRADIGKYSEASERDRIFRTFDSVPSVLSQENKKFMYSRIEDSDPASASARTFSKAIQWLSDSGIVRKCVQLINPCMPLETFGSGRSFKIYMEDTGLLLAMMDDEVTASVLRGDRRTNKGAIAENVVAECLSKCGHKLYYLRSGAMEIDFITTMKGNVVAIEVKSGNNNRSKSLNSVKEKYKVKRRIKFENTEVCVTEDGIEHYPLFAAAFIDSMYDPCDLSFRLEGVDEVNAAVRRSSGNNPAE